MLSVQGNASTIGWSSTTSAVDAVVSWLLLVVKMERFGHTDGKILLGLVLPLIQLIQSVGLVVVVVVVVDRHHRRRLRRCSRCPRLRRSSSSSSSSSTSLVVVVVYVAVGCSSDRFNQFTHSSWSAVAAAVVRCRLWLRPLG